MQRFFVMSYSVYARSVIVVGSLLAACGGNAAPPSSEEPVTTVPTQPSAAGQTGQAGQTSGPTQPNSNSGGAGSGATMTAAPSGGAGQGAPATGGTQAPPTAAAGTGGAGTTAAAAGQPATAPNDPTSNPGVGPEQSKATGYGAMASGGGSSPARTAGSLAELQAAVDEYSGSGGLVLEYTGSFDFKSIPDPCTQHTRDGQKLEIKDKSNISIIGRDGSAANFGIHIKAASENIVIRNMTLGLLPGGGDSDMISLEGMSGGIPKNIWIDHNELFSSLTECEGAGDTSFDGMIDIKKGVDNVTISYNHLHDHAKVSLNGYSDDDSQTRHITFHHNVFENVGSRTPLQRHGYSHIVNNLFSKIMVSGINVRMGGYALVEANFFQDVKNPVTSRDSDAVGFWELRDNNLASAADVAAGNRFGITWDDGNDGTVNALDWTTSEKFPMDVGYSYEAASWACVRDGLRAVAGSGKKLATLTCSGESELNL
jgi:pectate lyase